MTMTEPPSEESREDKLKRQTTASFAALGKFVQEFELMVHAMRITCAMFFGDKQPIGNLFIFHQLVPVKVLVDCTRAIFETSIERTLVGVWNDASINMARTILSQIQGDIEKMMKLRNNLLHGTWNIGWASE